MHTRGFSSGGRGCGRGDFFGLDVEGMSRASRVGVGGVVISSVLISGLLLMIFAPGMWWVVTIYGWVVFPASGLLTGGISGERSALSSGVERDEVRPESRERQLLEAMSRSGSITPARAAIETPLSVSEAEELLGELASGGHIRVRVIEGGIFYSMWDPEEEPERLRAYGEYERGE